jgi:hypothetical protein
MQLAAFRRRVRVIGRIQRQLTRDLGRDHFPAAMHAAIVSMSSWCARLSTRNADAPALKTRTTLHRLDRIEHEVHAHLLQLDAVVHDLGQAVGPFSAGLSRLLTSASPLPFW